MTCGTTPEAAGLRAWTTTTALIPHQVDAVAKMVPTRVGALFMDMGTGKSRCTVELARIRATRGKIDRVVWFCPVSAKETIRYQIHRHTDCAPEQVVVFDDRTNEATLPRDAFWYVVGIESMSASARAVCTTHGLIDERTMVVVDESQYIKGHKALRTARVTKLAERARYRLILTGTPLTQGVPDLFSQMCFLSPKILGYRSWYSFSRNHLEYSDRHKGLVVRCHNVDYLAAKVRPYVYQVTKEECLRLPPKLYTSRACDLTDEQWEAYEAAKERFVVDLMTYDNPWGDLQSGVPIFRLFTALQGIVCGFDSSRPAGAQALPHRRLDLLRDALAELPPGAPVVVWAKYHHCIDEIVPALAGSAPVAQFHGGLSVPRRHEELERWRRDGGYLVATQAAGGVSLDLTAARFVAFYANGFKYAERLQAEDRCHRLGQSGPVTYMDLWANAKIEARIDRALRTKGSVVRAFRDEVEKVKTVKKEAIKALINGL